MFTRNSQHSSSPSADVRQAFTLVELLMAISVIAVLSTFVLVALAGVNQTAREDRTKAQLAKINELLMDKWASYQYRRAPATDRLLATRKRLSNFEQWLSINGGYTRVARDRLVAIRDLMRVELPNSKMEVVGPNENGQILLRDPNLPDNVQVPSLSRAYYQRAKAEVGGDLSLWTTDFESGECLYLILSQLRDADVSALEFFKENEIGDVDGDGMKEILDAWGRPILWLRWAPGFVSSLQVPIGVNPEQDDLFDPMELGDGYRTDFPQELPRALYPLVFSAGPDEKYGIRLGEDWFAVKSNPYDERMRHIGSPTEGSGQAILDNITNHLITTR